MDIASFWLDIWSNGHMDVFLETKVLEMVILMEIFLYTSYDVFTTFWEYVIMLD